MLNRISLRTWYLLVAICCLVLLCFALFVQYRLFLDPCPLCILQRLAFIWIGAWALLAAIVNPGRGFSRLFSGLILLGAAGGAWVASRHVWLQHLPPDQVPECGPGLNYMLDTLPFTDVLREVLFGSGSCAEVKWTLLGLSMPNWTLIWFIVLGSGTLWFTVRAGRRAKAER